MKILLSPAKTLDLDSKLPTSKSSQPLFADDAIAINKKLARQSKKAIGKLMHLSEKLAALNYDRYQEFTEEFTTENARPAVYTFAGDVYDGLDAYTLEEKHMNRLEDSVRMLSGMYGYLRPFDLMQPYRLEMGTKFPIARRKDLYDYWKDKITPALNEEIQEGELVVNLASTEYFKAVDTKKLKGELIAPVFKDFKNGKLKIISFFAKKARGNMARYLVETDAQTAADVLGFNRDGYKYSEAETKTADAPVFVR